MPPSDSARASAGHKIGQVVGDWWELYLVYPMLLKIADHLGLYLDNRKVSRSCRGNKIQWADADNNIVDYDFVLELDGSERSVGIPVAFFESFWRRGARHSKDKSRDDTNKLLPMRDSYPTARYLAIAACGEFTQPAREYVRNRSVDLFFVPKSHIIEAFAQSGLQVDYPDSLPETEKGLIADRLVNDFDHAAKIAVASNLIELAGRPAFETFEAKVVGALSALPQEIRFIRSHHGAPICFTDPEAAKEFLVSPSFSEEMGSESYTYEVTYSDGFEFSRVVSTIDELRTLHASLNRMVQHVKKTLGS